MRDGALNREITVGSTNHKLLTCELPALPKVDNLK